MSQENVEIVLAAVDRFEEGKPFRNRWAEDALVTAPEDGLKPGHSAAGRRSSDSSNACARTGPRIGLPESRWSLTKANGW